MAIEKKKHAHRGMLNGKTPIIVGLCLGIVAGVSVYGMYQQMEIGNLIALIGAVAGALGALSWVYTRAGQGSSTEPSKTIEKEYTDIKQKAGGEKNDV